MRAMKEVHATMFALILASGPASAGWVEVERFEDGTRAYADAASARRDGATAELAHLVRWGEPQRDDGVPTYLSTRVLTAYDCVGKREKYLTSTSYAGAMGDGVKVAHDANEAAGWDSISEDSLEDKLWHVACGR
jgi:hypothetical protein